MSLEEKVKRYRQIRDQINQLEDERKALSEEILKLLPPTKVTYISDFVVRRYQRLSIKTTVEEAKLFGAVKLEEVVDKEKIQHLIEFGTQIPNVSQLQYIQVVQAKRDS